MRQRRLLLGIVCGALLLGPVGLPTSSADPTPAPSPQPAVPPITQRSTRGVTADGLPTAQIDGTVFTQVVSGRTVFAGGEFTKARPAGTDPGSSKEVLRSNLMSFDIKTGKLTRFAPTVNGRVKGLALSSDGKLLYAVGNFTMVGKSARHHFAAFDVHDGHLKKLQTDANDTVYALAVTKKAIYLGGSFTKVNGTTRAQLAAISPTSGKLTGWAPAADNTVMAMTLTPDKRKVVVGGRFLLVNGIKAYGLAALDATTGKRKTWKVNATIHDYGTKAAIWSLRADRDTVYGTAYTFGGGNFEGAFAVDPAKGTIIWLQDCHGDTFDIAPVGKVVYTVGHPHFCSNIGGFPDPEPRTFHRSLAVTKAAEGVVAPNTEISAHYGDFRGQPAPSIINWFPDLTAGEATGLSQAAWSLSATSTYVVMGGEFTAVNGVRQQGLVRFPVPGKLPEKDKFSPRQGPVDTSSTSAPTVTAATSTTADVSWRANWDRDDTRLSYAVLRNGKVVGKAAAVSEFWNRPSLSLHDTGLTPATTYSYQIRAGDPDGNVLIGPVTRVTTPK